MFKDFKINNNVDLPIYRQLTNLIRSKVATGELAPGTKMPTVRELSDMIGIAQGTVKRTYDELESLGIVEKAQGKGTFISGKGEKSLPAESRKDRAMEAIDNMFDELEALGFSAMETEIFLELKKRERESRNEKIKVAIIECNTEVLSNLVDQLRSEDFDIYPHLLSTIKKHPYKIGDDMNLIITTATHFDELTEILPHQDRMIRIALSLTASSVHGLLMIPQKSKVGILCESDKFGSMIIGEIEKYGLKIEMAESINFSKIQNPKKWISEHDYILLPENYEKYCSRELLNELEAADKKGKLIICSYKMDKGSELIIEEQIKAIKSTK